MVLSAHKIPTIGVIFLLFAKHYCHSLILDFLTDFDAIPDKADPETCGHNRDSLSNALQLATNHTLLIPPNRTFHLFHGVHVNNIQNVRFQIDGTLVFERNDTENVFIDETDPSKNRPKPLVLITDTQNFTISSSKRGLIDGNGWQYWGIPFIGYLEIVEHRPKMIQMDTSTGVIIENIVLKDSPYYNIMLNNVQDAEIRHTSIVTRRTSKEGHTLVDLSAFNSDGIDVSGRNVHIHDVDIWTQDDCIAVKDNRLTEKSADMMFERIHCSGLGLVIGSIGGTHVSNITFRDSILYKTFKGIYLKLRVPEDEWSSAGLVENILFENITMVEPQQWPIWIGPAQQADARNPCLANPCSLCWPLIPGAVCNAVPKSKYRNITLKDVLIHNPKMSAGVILGEDGSGIENLVFENVLMTNEPSTSDAHALFPGLDEPINDPPLTKTRKWLFLIFIALLTAMILPLVIRSLRIYKKGGQHKQVPQDWELEPVPSPSPTRISQFCRILLFLISCTLFAIGLRDLIISNRMHQPDYFMCHGVLNGVAKGTTWPVPSCFIDETEKSLLPYSRRQKLSFPAIFFCMLTFSIACLSLFWRQRPQQVFQQRERLRTDSTAIVSISSSVLNDSCHFVESCRDKDVLC